MLFWYGQNLHIYHITGHNWDVAQVRAKSQEPVMETERGSGVNGAGCSTFSALSFKATAWLHIRADPAPRQPAPGGLYSGSWQCLHSPLVMGRRKKSVLSLFGAS